MQEIFGIIMKLNRLYVYDSMHFHQDKVSLFLDMDTRLILWEGLSFMDV
jgi:hypothetical protein